MVQQTSRRRSTPLVLALTLGMVACAPTSVRAASGAQPVLDAPVLDAMAQELKRNQDTLRLEDYPPPYFIGYQLKEDQVERVVARDGSLVTREQTRNRGLFVEVRVGGYELDNTDDKAGQGYDELVLYQAPTDAPLDDHPDALRQALWLLTDQRYKEALAAYLRVKGMKVYRAEDEDDQSSYTREEPVRYIQQPPVMDFDIARWEDVARRVSAEITASGIPFDSSVEIDARRGTRWQVNTEGTSLLTGDVIYGIHVNAMARAPDGMVLAHSFDIYRRDQASLPPEEQVLAQAKQMLDELDALRKAPVLEPYTGPAILLPEATGVFFHEAVGHRLEGERQDNDEEGHTFKGQVGRQVMPEFLSVYEDPTLQTAGDAQLNGYYRYDDQAVPTSRVTLVDKGVLKTFILSRKPVEGFTKSNGHGRAQANNTPVARMGNLIVETAQPVTRKRLKEMLLEEAQRQGKPYGLIVNSITGGSTNTTSYGYQAFKGAARTVYRVDANTGVETLVRGVEIVGTPLASINKIVAADDTVGVFNGYCGAESGYVPVSTVAPATLFSEIELQRSVRTREKGQILPPPAP